MSALQELWSELTQIFHFIHAWHIVGFFALLLLAPLGIATLMKFRKYPTIHQLDEDARMPRVSADYFQQVNEEIVPCGFESLGIYSSTDAVTNAFFICKLYVNRDERVLLLVSSVYGHAPEVDAEPLQAHYCEFLSSFNDDEITQVLTNNNIDPGSFAPAKDHRVVMLPQIDDAAELFDYHKRVIQSLRMTAEPNLPIQTGEELDVPTYMQSFLQETYDRQVANGLLKLVTTTPFEDSYYCPTFIGSYILTWKELWPMKPMRIAGVKRASQQHLSELESLA